MCEPKSGAAGVEHQLRSSWPGLQVANRVSGGARTEVWSGFIGSRRVILRHSRRSDISRAWEWNLLEHLDRAGIGVPRLVPSVDGRVDIDGWHVYPYIEGEEPHSDDPRLTETVRAVHAETIGWVQRPGSASASDLLTGSDGGDVDLAMMPADLVEALRDAWRSALGSGRVGVVHGDCGPRNAIIDTRGRCVLIDWDEARVDDPLFDLPSDELEQRAAWAWEIATCWSTEPVYAKSLIGHLTRRAFGTSSSR
ncbi:aminoglycoside phosphotransferase [Rhodococcus sp. AQ5-07]|uniref:phosphotransferase enzyme family protein n=1 Tax=Rhodococcus sp. AQ5-07 TaxID=2054902 RepID=UPI000DBFE0C3|nr:phosphotransferase [Rhodococcus sp. AQ5-07]RAL30791.1 aminoglycoside phosphotransferase [Rhodococcus sp. AQ5-07]